MTSYDEYIWGDRFKEAFPNLFFKTEDVDFARDVVITHNADLAICDEYAKRFRGRLWFGQNICTDDKRFVPIPIGLENDYVSGQPRRKQMLYEAANEAEWCKPVGLCYYNGEDSHADRKVARKHFFCQSWCTMREKLPYATWLDDMVGHKFIVCPRGNGLDCHRSWEALYLGRYPVMKRMHSLEQLFVGLPVLFVDDWSDVTDYLLRDTADSFIDRDWDWDKLKFSWWKGLIEGAL